MNQLLIKKLDGLIVGILFPIASIEKTVSKNIPVMNVITIMERLATNYLYEVGSRIIIHTTGRTSI